MAKISSQFRIILQNAPSAEFMFTRVGTIILEHEQGIDPLQLAKLALARAKIHHPQSVSRLMVESVKPINYGYFALPDMAWSDAELAITNKKQLETVVLPPSNRATNIGSKFDSKSYFESKEFIRKRLNKISDEISQRNTNTFE